MKEIHMQRILSLIAMVFLALAAPLAARGDDAHHKMDATAAGAPAADAATTAGVVKKVDKDQGKITIQHGPLENLGMPAMTMVFRVKEPEMLDKVTAGDKIQFVADKIDGAFTVTKIEAAK
jgi:Cu(I)/Ag(I) efflux system protein CusF